MARESAANAGASNRPQRAARRQAIARPLPGTSNDGTVMTAIEPKKEVDGEGHDRRPGGVLAAVCLGRHPQRALRLGERPMYDRQHARLQLGEIVDYHRKGQHQAEIDQVHDAQQFWPRGKLRQRVAKRAGAHVPGHRPVNRHQSQGAAQEQECLARQVQVIGPAISADHGAQCHELLMREKPFKLAADFGIAHLGVGRLPPAKPSGPPRRQ